jgi:LytR cell envelope-related transcriptional attenuator
MDSNPQPDGRPTPDPEHSGYPAPENAVRSPGEIGGKKFRVGLDDAYVPFRNRTKRRRRTMAAALGGLLILGVGAYGLVNLVTAPTQTAAAAACKAGSAHAPAGSAELPVAAAGGAGSTAGAGAPKFTLNVYNSTQRQGLAAHTAAELKQRGFAIGQVTNDPLKENLTVAAQVRGAASQTAELHEVAAEVPGAQIKTDGRADPSVDLVLGAGFSALASTQQVTTDLQAAAAAAASATAAADEAAASCSH